MADSTQIVDSETVGDRLDPAGLQAQTDQAQLLSERQAIDASCKSPVLLFYASSVLWLLVGTVLALIASIKLHDPNFLTRLPLIGDVSFLTFGRVRPAHLDIVAFGWSAMVGLGTTIWLVCRLCRVTLKFPQMLVIAGILWNIGVLLGLFGVLSGQSNSIEWIEFPPYATFILFLAFAIIAIWTISTFTQRREKHVYVSLWYIFAAMFWFPWIYATIQILTNSPWAVHGVAQETVHWWFGHNTLGVFFTPMGLATIYYLLPKVIGRPIHSYYLSILGFWSLALFYNWAGGHHLISGPIPAWLITLSVAGSVMMFIPVITTAINHHLTAYRHLDMLKFSPVLRFVVFGAMAYTLVSFQGSMMSVRVLNEPFHFTHHTIAHSHLGLYGFYTMVMFGAVYYVMPRLTGREFASAGLMRLHFWCVAIGILWMFFGLTIGGVIQGFEWNQAARPFNDLVAEKGLVGGAIAWFDTFKTQQDQPIAFMRVISDIMPFLKARSYSGMLIFVGHLAFALLVFWNLFGGGVKRLRTLLWPQGTKPEPPAAPSPGAAGP
jgi:cytochrome c oxidase cbb3-type subunit I